LSGKYQKVLRIETLSNIGVAVPLSFKEIL